MITGWRYWYRLYFGWLPIQFCAVCGHWYWGGLPRWWIVREVVITEQPTKELNYRYVLKTTWEASWKDYCSQKCCDEDPSVGF